MVGHKARALVLMITLLFLLSTIPPSLADGRQTGAVLPSWEIGDTWNYHTDDTNLDSYPIVLVDMTDSHGVPATGVLCNYPKSRDIDQVYKVDTKDSVHYDMSVNEDVTELGDWMIRKVIANNPRCTAGEIMAQGTYNKTDNNTGIWYIHVADLASDGDDIFVNSETEYVGDLYFIVMVDGRQTTTVDKACAFWKAGWSSAEMDVDDNWTLDCTETEDYDEHWESKGNLQGEFDDSGTYTFIYDMNYTVSSKAAKIVRENTYPEAFKVRGTGTVDWEWTDGTNTANGQWNVIENKWYADEGNYWDAGWGIEYDTNKQLLWSTYGPPIDWNDPPEVTKSPPVEIDIEEEEEWVFWDYTVVDDDPGACGKDGFEYSIGATYDGEDVLEDLTIDDEGYVRLTPTQKDVADGYDIVITVMDSCPDAVESVDIPFILNIKNLNDPPVAEEDIMYDLWLSEGNHTTTDWSLNDVFSDEDMGISNLTGMQYDPLEALTYIIQSNGSLWVDIDSLTGKVTFTAPDMGFPEDQNVSLTIVAQDTSKAKASDGLTVRVRHMNHAPTLKDGDDHVTIKEDETITLNFEDYFTDVDVDNPNYITKDTLYYFGWARSNMSVSLNDELFTIEPWQNWNGDGIVNIRASDSRGGRVETTIDVTVEPVNDPPTVYFQTPDDEEIDLDEPHDGLAGNGYPRSQLLSVTAHDVDDPIVRYNWTIRDVDSGEVRDWAILTIESMLTFKTDYKGEFADGKITGGDDYREYIIEATITDGKVTLEAGKWVVTVYDVNRPPKLRDVTVNINRRGALAPVAEDDFRNYTLQYEKVYQFNIFDTLTDDDSLFKDIDCTWSTDRGYLAQGTCAEYGAINVSAGVKKGVALANLKPGTHVITVDVEDEKGAKASVSFTVKVSGPPPSDLDLFMEDLNSGGTMFYVLISIIVLVVMFTIGFSIAYFKTRRDIATHPAKPYKPISAQKKGDPYRPPGERAKKKVKKKARPPSEAEKVEKPKKAVKKVKKKTRKVWEEDIPDDWK